MVDQFNTFVGNQGLDPGEMQALCIDLLSQDEAASQLKREGGRFDIVVVRAPFTFCICFTS
jgi:hypothetical protein